MDTGYKPNIAFQGCVMVSPDGTPHSPLEGDADGTRCFLLLHPEEMDEAELRKAIKNARQKLSFSNERASYAECFTRQLDREITAMLHFMVSARMQDLGVLPAGVHPLRKTCEHEGLASALRVLDEWEADPDNSRSVLKEDFQATYNRISKDICDHVNEARAAHIHQAFGSDVVSSGDDCRILLSDLLTGAFRQAQRQVRSLLEQRLDAIEAHPDALLDDCMRQARQLSRHSPVYPLQRRQELAAGLEQTVARLPERMQVMLMHYDPVCLVADSDEHVRGSTPSRAVGLHFSGRNMVFVQQDCVSDYAVVYEEFCHLINSHILSPGKQSAFTRAYHADMRDEVAREFFREHAYKGIIEEFDEWYRNASDRSFGAEVIKELCWMEDHMVQQGVSLQKARGIIVETFPRMGKLYLEYRAAEEKEYQRITFGEAPETGAKEPAESMRHRARAHKNKRENRSGRPGPSEWL